MKGVESPQMDWIDVELLRQHIHQRFDRERRLRHAEAAEGARRRVIRIHGVAVRPNMRDIVRSGGVGGGARHHLFSERGVGAGVAVQLTLRRNQPAIVPGANLNTDLRGVALGMHQHAFVPIKEQLHRPLRGVC